MADKRFLNSYSRLDRALHHMAFLSSGLQEAVADIEDRLHRRELNRIPLQRPVFITALPRAGTTLLLNLLYGTGEFATHTYQSMPFVLCPLTWQRMAAPLRAHDNNQMERAHADGLQISTDSAEAFEEVLWQRFWAGHYKKDHIIPWSDQDHPEFVRFFENHLRKQLLLANNHTEKRYMSKNNMNIARIPLLRRLYPDAKIVVPFRHPVQQAVSLLNQHRLFLKMHRDDPFSLRYMKGIGHYDFGENLLPINFSGWAQEDRRIDACQLSFWLEYWMHTYEHILSLDTERVIIFPFDRFIENPSSGLDYLADSVDLSQAQRLKRQANQIRWIAHREINTDSLRPDLLDQCHGVFSKLNEQTKFTA